MEIAQPTTEQILSIMRERGVHGDVAKRIAQLDNIETALAWSTDMEDLKVCMTALIEHMRLRP